MAEEQGERVVVTDGELIFERNKHTSVGFNPKKVYMIGEKYSGMKPRGPLQNFEQLKREHVEKQILFDDSQFVPGKIDLGSMWQEKSAEIQWLRPKDIVASPKMIQESFNRFDVNQGAIGDCWFLAALTNITRDHELMEFIVPTNQHFDRDYAGIFHFRFWQYGRWIDVVIDDRLPTYNGQLIFSKSKQHEEFWTPLLEKAYAKLNNSYKSLEGGFVSEALQDLTGGLSEVYRNLQERAKTVNFFEFISNLLAMESFMGCGIMDSKEKEGVRPDGLYTAHAYSITDAVEVNCKMGNLYRLLRLRNPWGFGEWTGNWNDKSQSWDLLTQDTKQQLLNSKSDGEFWMQYEDFISSFDLLELCHITHWKSFMADGGWMKAITNGGPPNNSNFFRNPQFLLSVNGPEKNRNYRILIGLLQKHRRDQNLQTIPGGFRIYAVTNVPDKGRLSQDFFVAKNPLHDIQDKIDCVQITGHIYLPNGTFCIIPYIEDKTVNCEFLLRVYSNEEFTVRELEENMETNLNRQLNRCVDSSVVADKAMLTLFRSYAGDDEQINWKELKTILDLLLKPEKHEVSKDICRAMLALADRDISGKLNFQEFFQLWEDIGKWRGIFRLYDTDFSNTISITELREALKDANITVSDKVLKILVVRYDNGNDQLNIEDFLHCCVRLNLMLLIFEARYRGKINLEDWLVDTMYT